MAKKVTIHYEDDFEVDGVSLRVYRDALWADGGVHDDYLIRHVSQVEDAQSMDETFEIEITDKDIHEALAYLGTLEDDES